MDIYAAIDLIESCSGFTDESTPVGEAWAVVHSYLCRPLSQPEPEGVMNEKLILKTYCDARRSYCYDGPEHENWQRDAERGATMAGLRAVLQRYSHPTIQPVPEGMTDEGIMRLACTSLGYEYTPSLLSDPENGVGSLDALPSELLAFARAVLQRYSHPTIQPVPEGVTDEAWQEFIEQVQHVQHVALREGEGPRFDLVETALAFWREATPLGAAS